MVPPNALDDPPIRLLYHIDIGEIVPLSDIIVVVYQCVVDNRSHTVPLKDGVIFCVPDPDMPVVVDIMQVVSVDDDGLVEMSILVLVKSDVRYVDIFDNDCARSPTSVTVIRLPGSQWDPTDTGAKVQPGYSAWIPGRSDIQEGRA
jgi:hypothetical protein